MRLKETGAQAPAPKKKIKGENLTPPARYASKFVIKKHFF